MMRRTEQRLGVKLGRSIVTEIFPEPVNLSFELVV
jgi:hypothetical protein